MKRKLRISAYFFCSFNFHLNSILFKGYFWLATPEKTLRFPRATLQLPQKKLTSSGIFSRCFSRRSLRVFSYAREVVHSTYIHLDPAIMAVVWSGGPLTPVGIARVRRSL